MSMTNPANDYATGDREPSAEDVIDEEVRLTESWSADLDRDVIIDYSYRREQWEVEIDGTLWNSFNTVPQLEAALTTLMNGG